MAEIEAFVELVAASAEFVAIEVIEVIVERKMRRLEVMLDTRLSFVYSRWIVLPIQVILLVVYSCSGATVLVPLSTSLGLECLDSQEYSAELRLWGLLWSLLWLSAILVAFLELKRQVIVGIYVHIILCVRKRLKDLKIQKIIK